MLSEFVTAEDENDLDTYRSIMEGALSVALSADVWPVDLRLLTTTTLIKHTNLYAMEGPDGDDPDECARELSKDEGMITLIFERIDDFEQVDIINRDLYDAAVFAVLWNMQPVRTGDKFNGVLAVSDAAKGFLMDEKPELNCQIMRDWIFNAAFGNAALIGDE